MLSQRSHEALSKLSRQCGSDWARKAASAAPEALESLADFEAVVENCSIGWIRKSFEMAKSGMGAHPKEAGLEFFEDLLVIKANRSNFNFPLLGLSLELSGFAPSRRCGFSKNYRDDPVTENAIFANAVRESKNLREGSAGSAGRDGFLEFASAYFQRFGELDEGERQGEIAQARAVETCDRAPWMKEFLDIFESRVQKFELGRAALCASAERAAPARAARSV